MSSEKIDPDTNTEVVGAFEAKTHLSRLLRKANAGRRIIITQRGRPMAQLSAVDTRDRSEAAPKTLRGDMKGKIWIADDFCGEIEDMREYME